MITLESIDKFAVSLEHFFKNVPSILADMRATVEAKESLERECDNLRRTLDTMNLALQDLREDKNALSDRISQLLRETARLEQLLAHIGEAVQRSQPVQDAITSLQGDGKRMNEARQ